MRPAMHACTTFDTHQPTVSNQCQTMTDWSLLDREWPPETYDPLPYGFNSYYPEKPPLSQCFPPQADNYLPPSPTLTLLLSSSLQHSPTLHAPSHNEYLVPKGENPREIRNKAEKQRRDKLNHSISELASMVPPVVAANRKIDKTGVLRLTAHYLRAHQYVFGDSIGSTAPVFNSGAAQAVLGLLKGFLLTTTYKGIVVVVSQNVQEYLGYTELDLFGQNILNITHQDDRQILKEQLMPRSQLLGTHGELLIPDGPDGKHKVAEALAKEKRNFVVRLKKLSQRSEPAQYISCTVEGTLRKSDRACRGYNRCCQMVRRARARGDNPCSSGNDIVFIGVVRPTTETFMTESTLESYKMEYRTRHSIDGEIIQCDQRIALVTGYMIHEVNGVNAMNFMHRDDVHWVIIALRDMYVQNHLFGESCYRLMTRNGQFIYMKTRGRLDVDEGSRAVRSFVCTNTVVEEQEGKQLIKQMKKKFTLMANNNTDPLPASLLDDYAKKVTDSKLVPVEDPRKLEKIILHLVRNLPSPIADDSRSITPDSADNQNQNLPLAIIPPRKEKIVSAIEKIYGVIKSFNKESKDTHEDQNLEELIDFQSNPETQLKDSVTPPASSPKPQTYTENKSSQPPVEPASSLPGPSKLTREMRRQKNISRKHLESSAISHSLNSPQTGFNTTNDIGDLDINFKTAVSDGVRAGSIHFNFPIRTPGGNSPARLTYMSTSTSLKQQPRILVYTGCKRQRTSEDHGTPKKKVPVSETVTRDEDVNTQIEQEDDDLEFVAPIFNSLFDESIEGDNLSQVDSTLLSSLEQKIDPSFPDLLISEEVQDILDQIEGQKEENQMEISQS